MGLSGIQRIEEFQSAPAEGEIAYDPMLQRVYDDLRANAFSKLSPSLLPVYIDDISAYNKSEGLPCLPEEEDYLRQLHNVWPSPYRQRGFRILAG